MAAERIAHGEVVIEVNDTAANAAMERIERKFDRTMSKIDHDEAVATVDANIAPLEDKIKQAQRRLKKWEGEKARKRIDANTDAIDTQIKKVKREIKRLEADKAVVEIEVKGDREAIAAIEKVRRAEVARAEAVEKREQELDRVRQQSEKRRMSAVLAESRSRTALNKQRDREENQLRVAEQAAYRESEKRSIARRKAQQMISTGIDREAQKIGNLQKQYARLTDKLETIAKKRPIGKEARAKVELDAANVILQMERIKAELNFMGSHPPVDIKADVDRKGLRKVVGFFSDIITTIGNKAAGLGDLTLRLGPFTSSIRQAAVALSFLGPTITDILGAASSLIGVLGAGISGAAVVGSGAVTGLGLSFLGLKFATRNTAQEITNARTAINAYQKAEEKYGATNPKTVKKLKELNHVMASISPLARETAKGVEHFYDVWDKHTGTTRRNLGIITREGFRALNQFTPTWAHRTNEMSTIMRTNLDRAFSWLRSKQGVGTLDTILKNFNQALPAAFHGLGAAGQAFLNFAKEGSKYLPQLFDGFDRWMGKLLNFTQQDNFGGTIRRWVRMAGDVVRFLTSAGTLAVHFFGDASSAGDRFINTMSDAMDRWDEFVQSTDGKKSLDKYFQNSVDGVEALYQAFKPLIELFTLWSIGLEPAVKIISEMFAWLTRTTETIGKLVGLNNPLNTLGATLGAMWAVGKIGAFVSMLARVVALLKEAAIAGGIFGKGGVLRTILSGGLLKGARGGSGILEAGTAAAAEMRAAVAEGGTAAAAEIRAALISGGLIAGAEEGAAIEAASAAGGATMAAEIGTGAAVGGAAKGVGGAVVGGEAVAGVEALGGATAAVGVALTALPALFAGAGVAALIWGGRAQSASEKAAALGDNAVALGAKLVDAAQGGITRGMNDLSTSTESLAQANHDVASAQKTVDKLARQGKTGTDAYRQAIQQLNAALDARTIAEAGVRKSHTELQKSGLALVRSDKARAQALEAQNKALNESRHMIDLTKYDPSKFGGKKAFDLNANDLKKYANQLPIVAGYEDDFAASLKAVATTTDDLRKAQQQQTRAQQLASLASVNYQRALASLRPMAQSAAATIDSLTKKLGAKKVADISLKFPDPRKAQAVMGALNKTIASGTPKNKAFNVVANSKTAEEALRRLNRIKLTPKRLDIIERGGSAAVKVVERLTGQKIPPKLAKIISEGGPKALAVLRDLYGYKLPVKTQHVKGNASPALTIIRALLGLPIPAKTQVIKPNATSVFQTIASLAGRILAPIIQPIVERVTKKRATGGMLYADPDERRAAGNTPIRATGSVVRKPTFVVGEETGNSREYVISANPRYRKRNRRLLQAAAGDLGAQTMPHFASGGAYYGTDYGQKKASGPGFYAGLDVGKALPKPGKLPKNITTKKARKRLRKKFKTNDPYVARVKGLLSQQDQIEREISIRQNEQPAQPESFLVENGKDPVTGDMTYKIDDKAIASYASSFDTIIQAQDALVNVLKQIVQTIPNALTSLGQRKRVETDEAAQLRHSIKNNETAIKNEMGKKPDKRNKGKINKWRSRITLEKKKLSSVVKSLKNTQDDVNLMKDTRPEAGFDFREATDAAAASRADKAGVQGIADKQLADTLPADGGTGAGGGGTDAPLTYGEQAALTDAANAQTLRDYGSNFQAGGSGYGSNVSPGTQAMGGGQGLQGNAGLLGGPNAVNAVASSLGSSSVQGGIAASSIAAKPVADGGFASTGAAVGSTATASGSGDTNVNIVNNYQTMPEDPHTWSQGVAFEIGAAV